MVLLILLRKNIRKKLKIKLLEDICHYILIVLLKILHLILKLKKRCITAQSKFGSKPVLSAKFIKKVCSNNELIDKILDANNKNDNKDLKKTDGKRKIKLLFLN